jgi:hypothetical protein
MEMPSETVSALPHSDLTVPAGRLPPWRVDQLPEPPRPGWRLWVGLIGPGVVLAGTSIGSGEWLFGPAVSAQYGATLLWVASISIILQVFCNLMMMRYTLYCGEPILVGGLRTWPGPLAWIIMYAVLELGAVWPYNASNAAVPLAAAIIGHLPGDGAVNFLGWPLGEVQFVRLLGITIFLLAFVPLVFGGTIYRMLEKVMSLKLVLILSYLTFVAVFMVSPHVAWEVFTGFFKIGTYPERAETILVDPHFKITYPEGSDRLVVKGTIENDREHPLIAEFKVNRTKQSGPLSPALQARRDAAVAFALKQMRPGSFFVETEPQDGVTLSAAGKVEQGTWVAERFTVRDAEGLRRFDSLEEMPPRFARRLAELVENRGLEERSIVAYIGKHGGLPDTDLDWFMVAAFAAIAGAGGLTNTMFSNYTREKGWGMGAHVGAIPSAIGGRTITLSHTGKVFPIDGDSLRRWRGWLRHIFRDQVAVWMVASFLGMALPCMLSIEFIRNATVAEHRVAAMTAEGLAQRYPDHSQVLWTMTLLCGFLVLAPGQISAGDQISRRWTDIVWTSSAWARSLGDTSVKYVYYSILAMYGVWGLVILCLFPALKIALIGAVLQNVALGCSSLQAWYANRTLMPRALQPHWLLQVGTVACSFFFFLISGVVLYSLMR